MTDIELKQMWAEHDRKMEAGLRLNRLLLAESRLKSARSALDRLSVGLALHAAAWLVAIVALGGFIYSRLAAPRLALCAILLDIYAIGMLIAVVRQIVFARSLDYSAPVAQLQARIEALRVLRIRFLRWALVAGTVLWAPCAVVACYLAFGVEISSPGWLSANIALGLAMIPVSIWLARRFADRPTLPPFLATLARDLAGRSLSDAARVLAEIARFQQDA